MTGVPPIRIALVLGTRPEAIKMLELVRQLRADPRFNPGLFLTGQHREMVDEILRPFGVGADVDLDIMLPGQTLNDIVNRLIPRLDQLYEEERPELVLVQGDTTSAMCAALAAFHRRIAVGHIEAGLRSGDRFQPYPEEVNRRVVSAAADLHFAPTSWSARNLLNEGTPRASVVVTGNTVIDALLATLREQRPQLPWSAQRGRRMVLITLHRREGWDQRAAGSNRTILEAVFFAIRDAARDHRDFDFVYAVHLNPRVRGPAHAILGREPNVHLLAPVPYVPFVHMMAQATAILTDSGGIQEEAPSLGVPVLVLRNTTERPEGLRAGNKLIGVDPVVVRAEIRALLAAPPPRLKASAIPAPSPFGDGRASSRIVDAILNFFGRGPAAIEFDDADPEAEPAGPDKLEGRITNQGAAR
jgi:UDP-N-acetylglucosamine 2-epimerase (non-hydrolysing)